LTHRDAGAVFLDTASRTYLQMDWDQVPGIDPGAPIDITWGVVGDQPPPGQPVTVEILMATPRPGRWSVVLDPRPAWAPCPGEALTTVLGCANCAATAGLVTALASLGFPVQGSAFLTDLA